MIKTGLSRARLQRWLIIIMPDGDDDKWYIDSPVLAKNNDEKVHWQWYPFLYSNARTIAAKNGRAIAALSIGEFGALHIVLNYLENFGAAAV